MRVLCAIVADHPSWSVTAGDAQFARSGAIRRQPIGANYFWLDASVLQQLS
jgi:hypothetical protein